MGSWFRVAGCRGMRGWGAVFIAASAACCAKATAAEVVAAASHRVQVVVTVTGELVAGAGADGSTARRPVDLQATFDFDENGGAGADGAAVRRDYREAQATMRFGDAEVTSSLAPDARRILVARRGTTPVPYLAEGVLSVAEFDLLDVPFDALVIDELLPRHPVSIGSRWEVSADVAAGLLAIDTVESGGIEARLLEVGDAVATVGLSGIVDGAADGVPTHVTVEGTLLVPSRVVGVDAAPETDAVASEKGTPAEDHLLDAPVSRVAAVVIERRQASHVAPGFDVEARVTVTRTPLSPRDALREPEPSAGPPSSRPSAPAVPGMVWYHDDSAGFDLVHDVRWRCVEDGEKGLVMRYVDRGALVGQCSISMLPPADGRPLPTRSEVERDVQRSLAGQIARIDGGDQRDRGDGARVVRVTSSGTAGRLPFRWIHYVVAVPQGGRAAVTFMVEESLLERFGAADEAVVAGLVFTPGKRSGTAAALGTAAVPDDREGRSR